MVFIGAAMLSAVMEGGNGFASTLTNGAIDDNDIVITVDSTNGFLSADYIILGNETILYTGKNATQFTGCTRGYNGTTAVSHGDNSSCYTADTSAINHALGFNVAATSDSMGWWAVVSIPLKFFTTTLPKIVTLNWSYLQGGLAIIGWFFFASGAGLIITMALSLMGARRV